MRKKNSIKNLVFSMSSQIVLILLNFVSQAFFLRLLGKEYLGINSLFSNIISMLSITELGISTAIIYQLYKPLAEKNEEKILMLLDFYKKCYRIISIIILLIGFSLTPFLHLIVEKNAVDESIYMLFFLFLVETVVSYSLTYKRSIIYADQKNYIISIIHTISLTFLSFFQIISLLIYKNYVIYLILKIVFRITENIIITITANKMYPFLKQKNFKKIDKVSKRSIFKNIKGLFYHKISWTIINGTDNIIISSICGVGNVGIYSNYLLICNALEQIITQVFTAITASVGNLLVTSKEEKVFCVYKRTDFICFIISTIFTVGVFCVSEPFILLISDDNGFIFGTVTVFIICIMFYLKIMRRNICIYKDAAGIFYEDRNVAFLSALVNVAVSIILALLIGINGVFVGTIISYLIFHLYSYPKYTYRKIFNKTGFSYVKQLLKYLLITIICMFVSKFFCSFYCINNIWIEILKNGIIAVGISVLIITILYFNSNEYKFLFELLKNKTEKGRNKYYDTE